MYIRPSVVEGIVHVHVHAAAATSATPRSTRRVQAAGNPFWVTSASCSWNHLRLNMGVCSSIWAQHFIVWFARWLWASVTLASFTVFWRCSMQLTARKNACTLDGHYPAFCKSWMPRHIWSVSYKVFMTQLGFEPVNRRDWALPWRTPYFTTSCWMCRAPYRNISMTKGTPTSSATLLAWR